MREKIINIIMDDYGITKRQATDFYKRIDNDFKKELLKGHESNSKKSFYND